MSLPEKYLNKVIPSLSPYNKKKFKSGWGYTLACPFCSPAQKRESKANEKCASLYPVEGSPYLMFSCLRGMNGGTQGASGLFSPYEIGYLHQALASRDASSLDA